jgi:hypothetical protein
MDGSVNASETFNMYRSLLSDELAMNVTNLSSCDHETGERNVLVIDIGESRRSFIWLPSEFAQ